MGLIGVPEVGQCSRSWCGMCPSVPPQPPTLSTCLLFALYAGVFTTLCVASFLLGESTLWLQGRLSRYATLDLVAPPRSCE